MHKHLIAFLVLVSLMVLPSFALGACRVDVSRVRQTETSESYIQLTCPVEENATVSLLITDGGGGTVYQRNYPNCEGIFQSEEIYLRLDGTSSHYTVELAWNTNVYQTDILLKAPKLENNTACSTGVALSEVTGQKTWLSATVLDLASLASAPETYPVHASNAYTLGEVTFSLSSGQLAVSFEPKEGSDCSLLSSSVDIAFTAVDARALGTKKFHGLHTSLGQSVPMGDARYICVLLQLKVSYIPSALQTSPPVTWEAQIRRWEDMQSETAEGSNG